MPQGEFQNPGACVRYMNLIFGYLRNYVKQAYIISSN